MKYASMISVVVSVLGLASFGVGADTSGCQSADSASVKSTTIRTNYWMLYVSETDTSYPRAQFRFGADYGTTLELTGASMASFADQPLAWNATLDWYERAAPGQLESGAWSYTNNDGKTFHNSVPAHQEARLPATLPASLPASASYELVWEGPPLRTGETMEAILATDANRLQFIAIFQTDVGATSLVLPSTELAKLPRAPTHVVLQRHENHPLQEDTGAGGNIVTTFESPPRLVTLQ